MKNLILEFRDQTPLKASDPILDQIEYSEELNLMVLKGTQTAAIKATDLVTTSVTDISNEASDQEKVSFRYALGTRTKTDAQREQGDNDPQRGYLLATQTFTEANKEPTDRDR